MISLCCTKYCVYLKTDGSRFLYGFLLLIKCEDGDCIELLIRLHVSLPLENIISTLEVTGCMFDVLMLVTWRSGLKKCQIKREREKLKKNKYQNRDDRLMRWLIIIKKVENQSSEISINLEKPSSHVVIFRDFHKRADELLLETKFLVFNGTQRLAGHRNVTGLVRTIHSISRKVNESIKLLHGM